MTTSASTGFEQQFNQSTRLRTQAAEEAAKPREAAEGVADIYLAAHKKREAEKIAAEQRDIAAGRIRIL
jgi:hypothetical protein